PKLGILLGVTLLGLSAAGVLAGYLMKREMLNARLDQVHAIVELARNMAAGLQKQVDAGQLTKEAARAEFGRRANSMTYDNGAGAYSDDRDTKLAPIMWALGLALLGIAAIAGSIAWLIGRSIARPLGQLGARMRTLADGSLDGEIPGIGRGDEIGAMAATVQI